MFSALSAVAKILLLAVGPAGVERTFSTMNRTLSSERSRLIPTHVDALIKVCVEGPNIPNIRDATDEEADKYCQFINKAYDIWEKKKHVVPYKGFYFHSGCIKMLFMFFISTCGHCGKYISCGTTKNASKKNHDLAVLGGGEHLV